MKKKLKKVVSKAKTKLCRHVFSKPYVIYRITPKEVRKCCKCGKIEDVN